MIFVLIIEPAHPELGPPESELSVSDQINDLVGPFPNYLAAQAWISLWERPGQKQFRFLIKEPVDAVLALAKTGQGTT